MKFVLVGLVKFGSKKEYYQAILIDNEGNTSNVFVDLDTYNDLKNLLYKDITSIVQFVYDRGAKNYRLSIKK